MIKRIFSFILIIFLSFWAIRPLFVPGFFPIHDSAHPQRINQMQKAVASFHIPPRWSPDLGYGYGWPQFSFYSPLPYYFGAVINFLISDALISTKIIFAVAIIFSGIFMFLLVREIFGFWPGIVAAIFYIYSPYHSLDLYVRGALAELWGIMWIPLILYFLIKIGKEKDKKLKWIVLGGFFYAFLILSHNITALIFTIFLLLGILSYLIYSLVYKKPKYFILHTSYFILLAFLLSCYFWLPAILESKYTHIDTMTGGPFGYRAHFIAFRQIWDSPWDYGGSAGIFSGLSYMVGKLHLILALLTVLLTIIKRRYLKENKFFVFLATCYLLLATFLTNARSDFIWCNLPFMSFIQFPWRLLIFVMVAASFLSGIIISFIANKHYKLVVALILITMAIVLNKNYFKPNRYLNVDQNYYLSGENFITWATAQSEEYLPIWRPKKTVFLPKQKIVIRDGSFKLETKRVGFYKLSVNLKKETEILINESYFPNWQVFIDGKETEINYQKDGLIRFICPKGEHKIKVLFNETRLRFLANSISASTLFLLFAFFVLKLH